jgi:lipoprotein-anchoring transpeptidase ErfK/SrfK
VKPGDSLADIAAANGTTVDALLQRNNIPNPNLLYSGQVINLPGPGAPAPAAPPAEQPKPAAPPAEPTQGPKVTAPNSSEPVVTPKPGPPPPAPESANNTDPKPGETVKYTVQSGDRLYSIAAKYSTTVDAIIARNNISDPNMIYSGQVLTIQVGDKTSKPVKANAEVPAAAPNKAIPPKQSNSGKWIDVNISTQRITAYEGDTAVFSSLVSTGVAAHPTVVGTFKIYVKYLADDMTGGYGAEYYYLPAVPYTMYFYGGYAIHGTYWHHNFGTPMSHGCVNLPTDAAKWMYNWAPIGTPVVTHW